MLVESYHPLRSGLHLFRVIEGLKSRERATNSHHETLLQQRLRRRRTFVRHHPNTTGTTTCRRLSASSPGSATLDTASFSPTPALIRPGMASVSTMSSIATRSTLSGSTARSLRQRSRLPAATSFLDLHGRRTPRVSCCQWVGADRVARQGSPQRRDPRRASASAAQMVKSRYVQGLLLWPTPGADCP